MLKDVVSQLFQYFHELILTYRQNPNSFLGPEINEKLVNVDAWLCVFVVFCAVVFILKFPVGFILEYFWSKVLGGYVRDRGKKDNNKLQHKPFDFLKEFKKFQSGR